MPCRINTAPAKEDNFRTGPDGAYPSGPFHLIQNNSIYRDYAAGIVWRMRTFLYTAVMLVSFLGLLAFSAPSFSRENPATGSETIREGEQRADTAPSQPEAPGIFGFDIGMSGGYSTGVSVSNFHYRPFGNLYLKHKYIKFTAGISRYQDYLITNGAGKFERVNFTQPKVALSLYPHNVIELYGEYRFSAGDPSHYYRAHEATGGFLLDFNPVTVDASVNVRTTEYRFKAFDWQNTFTLLYSDINHNGNVTNYYAINISNLKSLDDLSATASISWYVIDTTSIDAAYYFLKSRFTYPNDSYYVHTGRIGAYSDVWKYISVYGGVSLGIDSEQYLIAGGDAGITFNILGYASLSVTYMPGYYKSRKSANSLDRLVEFYALYFVDYNIMGSENPYLQPSQIGKSFMNHSFNFSVSYKY